MPSEMTGYAEAVEAEAKHRLKAQMMHDLCIVAAGVISVNWEDTPKQVAKRTCDIYYELRNEAEDRIQIKRRDPR